MTQRWETQLIHPNIEVPGGFRSLAPPVFRGSTTLLTSAADLTDHWDKTKTPYTYGLYGTPTTFELAARIAAMEGGEYTFITPGGQASISLITLALASAGDHVLIADSAYGPTVDLAQRILSRLGISVELYDPMIGGRIEGLFRKNTSLVWCESPGSVTMEVQDLPAITGAAKSRGIRVALDNTYSAGIFLPAFSLGVDVSMQALTKYVGGHSDLLLGSVTTCDRDLYERLGDTHQLLGLGVSPDDCALALRGLETLALRLHTFQRNALEIASWLDKRPEVSKVLHPAFPGSPGHDVWRRDFTGSTSVFSVIFGEHLTREQLIAFVDSLTLFKLGYSWGGTTSLVMPFFDLRRSGERQPGTIVRFSIGLEAPEDLIADLSRAFASL